MSKRRRVLLWLGLVLSVTAGGYAGVCVVFTPGLAPPNPSVGHQRARLFGHIAPSVSQCFSLPCSSIAWWR